MANKIVTLQGIKVKVVADGAADFVCDSCAFRLRQCPDVVEELEVVGSECMGGDHHYEEVVDEEEV